VIKNIKLKKVRKLKHEASLSNAAEAQRETVKNIII